MPPELIGIPSWAGPVAIGIAIALWPVLARVLVDLAFGTLTLVLGTFFDALEWLCFPSSRRPRP